MWNQLLPPTENITHPNGTPLGDAFSLLAQTTPNSNENQKEIFTNVSTLIFIMIHQSIKSKS